MENNNYFVKIAYEVGEKDLAVRHYDAKINHFNDKKYNGKYLIGGGVYNRESGCFVFKAKDVQEAKELAYKNSFVKHKGFEYKKLSVTMFT